MRAPSLWHRRSIAGRRSLTSHTPIYYNVLWAKTQCKALSWKFRAMLARDSAVRESLFYKQLWCKGIYSEVDWWRRWLASEEGRQWSDAVQDAQCPLQDAVVAELVRDLPEDSICILDVGAGPVTHLGYTYPGKRLEITAVDPLADVFDRLLLELHVTAPVRTSEGCGELLLDRFERERFDIAYASNSLDHSYDPLRVIDNMLALVKRGRYVVLRHYENEGVAGAYYGLHQWNFGVEGDDLVIWNATRRHNVTRLLNDKAEVKCRIESARSHGVFDHSDWVVGVIRKL